MAQAATRLARLPSSHPPDRHRRAGWINRAFRAVAALALGCTASGLRAQDEVPYINTPDAVTLAMLELAGVGPRDHLIDLGSGDGRIVITAARRFGATALGVEIVPDLVAQSRENARRAGVADRTEFRTQDLFETELSGAQVITMYLLTEVNLQLRPKLLQLAPGTRIVSHDWAMGDWRPDRSLSLEVPDKPIGREKRSTVHLWTVPARVQGLWCTAGGTLQLTQRFQDFSATLSAEGAAAPVVVFDGRIAADELHAGSDPRAAPIALRASRGPDGELLQITRFLGAGSHFPGRRFVRAGPGGCR